MVPEVELWSPEQELHFLEELAETEANAFDLDLGLPTPIAAAEPEQRGWLTGNYRRMDCAPRRGPTPTRFGDADANTIDCRVHVDF